MMRLVIVMFLLAVAWQNCAYAQPTRAPQTIQAPSTISLKAGDQVVVSNHNDMRIQILAIGTQPNPAVEISIGAAGGCSPSAVAQGCLGPPSFMQTYTLTQGQKAEAIGLKVKLLDANHNTATLAVSSTQ